MNADRNGSDPDRGHEIIGPRVTVYHVYEYLVHGRSKEEILDILPITSEQYDRAILYIDQNRTNVEEIHRQIEERIARGNPPEIRARLEESHRKFEALKASMVAEKAAEEAHAGDVGRRQHRQARPDPDRAARK